MSEQFTPGDIIAADIGKHTTMRRVLGANSEGYIVENLSGEKRHVIPYRSADAWWYRIGGEK